MIPKILITPQAFELLDDMVADILGEEFEVEIVGGQISDTNILINKLQEVDGCIIGAETIDDRVLESCPNLQVLSRFGSGYSSIDIDAAKCHHVSVTIVPSEVNAYATARHALSFLLCITNNILTQNSTIKEGRWSKTYNLSPQHTKVGVVGFGPIGQEFARLCGMNRFEVNYYSRTDKQQNNYNYYNNLKSLIKDSDILSIHLNCNHETVGIFGKEYLDLMDGKYFINTSRGALLDEVYLYKKLKKNEIKGACLDVFINEPIHSSSLELASLDNVICSCHTAAYDKHTIRKSGEISLLNIKNYFKGNFNAVDQFIYTDLIT